MRLPLGALLIMPRQPFNQQPVLRVFLLILRRSWLFGINGTGSAVKLSSFLNSTGGAVL